MVLPFRTFALALAVAPVVSAWSPAFHENQTRLASAFVPRGMAAFLARHPQELLKGGRGVSSDQVPTIEEIEEQVQYIVRLGEEKRRSALVIRELGTLAHMVQLFMDPSASHGMTLLREHFQEYGDEHLSRLVVSQEPFWAVTAPLDPRPALLRWSATKWDRHRSLLEHFNSETGKPIGAWDTLSVPFAQLQLAYSNGVNATANLWIQLWRATGDTWEGLP
ncbi:MAG: hypothetical protein LWX11_00830 [Firmicutes bacterium]|nr:hypothetical protein [Bacillota bacterium]